MFCKYSEIEIISLLKKQIGNHFFELNEMESELLHKYFPIVYDKLEYCFSRTNNKYYSRVVSGKKETLFNPLHSCQWLLFLYYFANTIWKSEKDKGEIEIVKDLCDKIYGLSKIMSGAELYYEVDLPDVFMCDHPVGSVMGRAEYGEFFSFSQGCTVGNNHGKYPKIGKHVQMYSDSKILGDCNVGDNVVLAANTVVKDVDIPSDTIVFGTSPNLIFKPIKERSY